MTLVDVPAPPPSRAPSSSPDRTGVTVRVPRAAGATRSSRAVRGAGAALGALLLLAAGAVTAGSASAATPPGKSWVRAAHAVPGLSGMDFSVSGGPDGAEATLAADAPYGAIGDYVALEPGSYTAAVTPPGEDDAEPVLTTTFTVEPSSATTLAAIGTLDSPRLATLVDDLTPPPAGQARVRVLPAAATAPTVTVAAQGGPVIAEGAAFGQATAYADVPAGPWTLDLTAAGTSSTAPVTLEAGGVYTVAITDADGGGLRVLPVTDALGTGQAGDATGGGDPDAATDATPAPGGSAPGGSAPGDAAPVGGVQTGGGGAAGSVVGDGAGTGTWAATALLATALLAAGAAVVRRRATA